MTIEDRVDDIGDWRNPDARNHAIRVMRAAVKAAIEEEREACAQKCDDYAAITGHQGYNGFEAAYKRCADAIRRRSED